ncbi:MAG: hypothetical protein OEV94_06680 [Deltaproteobacteria bacterium]|nr:hypothetical protein [Deltaproteobacteria bacterium]
MKKLIAVFLFAMLVGSFAMAMDLTPENVAKAKSELEKGGSVNFDADKGKIFIIKNGWVWYVIDQNTQICTSSLGGSVGATAILVPCEAVKKGYPEAAPLMPWVK